MVPICSPKCRAARRDRRRRRVWMQCARCHSPVLCEGKAPHYRSLAAANKGRAFCSTACRDAWMQDLRIRTGGQFLATYNRAHASERMTADNPMARGEVRQRVSQRLRDMGHRPPVQGGNGRPMPEPQSRLLETLGEGWTPEFVVPVGMGRQAGYPTHYKLDLAHPGQKIAIEVDGPSHCSIAQQERDRRKDAFLKRQGWTVLRFTNQEVMADTAAVARTATSTTSR